jgi:tRNA(adenine34) deaminase
MIVEQSRKDAINHRFSKRSLNHGECPIAAIIFLDDEIISKGYASENADGRFLVHAELKALLEADYLRFTFKDRKRMQLFTNLEPCMMCLGAAMSFFIGEIHYALESPSDGAVYIAREWNPQSEYFPGYRVSEITGGILREESQKLFREFIEKSGPLSNWAKSLIEL